MAIDTAQIRPGMDVYGSDEQKIGSMAFVEPAYFVIQKGSLLETNIYVPLSAVTNIQDDQVRLNASKDQVENQGWDVPPPEDALEASGVTTQSTAQPIQRAEERLKVDKKAVQTGEVRISKELNEEEQSVDVPVKHDEVRVTSQAVDRPAGREAFADQDISIPVNEEQVDVTKEARDVEELRVDKRAVEDTERVSGTARRENLRVEADVDPSEKRDG